jgi:CheY-like chemotaxis protein
MVKTILWIEDEPFQLQGMIRPLKREGYEITTATDAFDAYELIKEKNFDLIIFDVLIPIGKKGSTNFANINALTGLELLKKLVSKNISIPPIILFSVVDLSKEANELSEKYNIKKVLVKHNYLPSQLKCDVEEIIGKG